ncbi:protein DBF4 homolog B [Ornithorhynchus anatinus]|uniref:protein DBF4 homolog B n=1 Tax=Ornithorhynchus anatinus TaxID=9258 RepID=UPI0019D4B1E4|nr:protein DBF4 homolog B [Ornithorhynchus anatinus]
MAETKLQAADPGVGAAGRPARPERIARRPPGPGPAVRPQPLAGKSFYLDLPAGKNLQFLMGAIQQLGGVIESFLSREVSCIVSSRREAKMDSGPAGPHPGRPARGKPETAPQPAPRGRQTRLPASKPENSVPMSRGKELLQKAIKNQGSGGGGNGSSGSSLLSHARSWGVRILHVDDMMTHMQQWSLGGAGSKKQEPKPEGTGPGTETPTPRGPPGSSSLKPRLSPAFPQPGGRRPRPLHSPGASGFLPGPAAHLPGNQPVGRLKPPYLKIEDCSRTYRPFQHQFRCFPELTFLGPRGSSPFEPPKAAPAPRKAKDPEGGGGSPCSALGHTHPGRGKDTASVARINLRRSSDGSTGISTAGSTGAFALDPTHYADVDPADRPPEPRLGRADGPPCPTRPATPAPPCLEAPAAEVSTAEVFITAPPEARDVHRQLRPAPRLSHRSSAQPRDAHRSSAQPRDAHRSSAQPRDAHRSSAQPRDAHRSSAQPRDVRYISAQSRDAIAAPPSPVMSATAPPSPVGARHGFHPALPYLALKCLLQLRPAQLDPTHQHGSKVGQTSGTRRAGVGGGRPDPRVPGLEGTPEPGRGGASGGASAPPSPEWSVEVADPGGPSAVAPQEGLDSDAPRPQTATPPGLQAKLSTSGTASGRGASSSPLKTPVRGLWPPQRRSAPPPYQSARAASRGAAARLPPTGPRPAVRGGGPPAPGSGPPAGENGWSESDWDVWLLSEPDGLRPSPGALPGRGGACVTPALALPDGAYASQLDSVLTPRAELTGRAGRGGPAPAAWHKDAEATFFSAFTACLGNWAS